MRAKVGGGSQTARGCTRQLTPIAKSVLAVLGVLFVVLLALSFGKGDLNRRLRLGLLSSEHGEGALILESAHYGHYFGSPGAASGAGGAQGGSLPHVLIATPMRNSAGVLAQYLRLLEKLDYPSKRLSLAILDSDSIDKPTDADRARVAELASSGHFSGLGFTPDSPDWAHSGTLYALLAAVPELRKRYASVGIYQHNFKERSGGAASSKGLDTMSTVDEKTFGGDRHAIAYQGIRRAVLARSRNHLIISALGSSERSISNTAGAGAVDYVLWIDSDVKDYDSDILKRLIRTGREIVVPNVVVKPGGRSYDLNSWRATEPVKLPAERNFVGIVTREETVTQAPGDDATAEEVRRYHDAVLSNSHSNTYWYTLELEGYPEFDFLRHKYLSHYRTSTKPQPTSPTPAPASPAAPAAANSSDKKAKRLQQQPQGIISASGNGTGVGADIELTATSSLSTDKIVRLDGVGGGMLLVNAELHRHGLIFPPFPYRKRIETEGLAMMALDFGVLCYGLPDVEVVHH